MNFNTDLVVCVTFHDIVGRFCLVRSPAPCSTPYHICVRLLVGAVHRNKRNHLKAATTTHSWAWSKEHNSPVSNLPLLSKVIEKAMALHLNSYMHDSGLNEKYQSAYKQIQSTQTALVGVTNDIPCYVNETKVVLPVLLDLSAVFDTTDHKILLDCMFKWLGTQNTSLCWFQSCLRGDFSKIKWMLCSVAQGSVLGPLVFSVYWEPICNNTCRHGIKIHTHTDDTKLYLSLGVSDHMLECLKKMEKCAGEIREWMRKNMIKLNDEKTEDLSFQLPFSLIGYMRLVSELVTLLFKLVSQHVTLRCPITSRLCVGHHIWNWDISDPSRIPQHRIH